MGVVDRYVIRQVIWPAFLGLLVFISLLIIPAVLVLARELVPKAVPAIQILKLVGYLLPSFLGIAIPMALLLGLLIGFGRMSSDREFVALQACGISVTRLLRPVAAVASVAFAATLYILLVALGDANQASREITFQILVDRAEGEVKPRVFFDKFTDLVLYVREMPPSGGWKDVFMVDSRPGQPQAVYVAERGRVNIDRNRKVVDMVLENAQRHVADANGEYRVERVAQSIISLNPEAIFPSVGPSKGEREMSIVELREHIAQLESEHLPTQSAWIEIYKKFSIPSACLVLGLIGLALGVNNRRDGRLSSFVIGLVVIFVYYAMLEGGSNFAKGRFIPTWLAVWAPNILFGVIGIWMFLRQLRGPGTPSRFTGWLQRTIVASIAKRAGTMRASGVSRILSVRIPFMGLLDRYVTLLYLRILALAFFGLLGIFYLSAFIDLSDEVLRGDAAWSQLFSHLYYASPQNVYYVLPMAVLLSTLVTIGLLTKNSELVVMKACGLSLYRVAAPLVLMALVTAVILVGVQERVLGQANHRAEAIRHVIRGGSPETFDVLKRRWVVGTNGAVYNYMYFNPASGVLDGLSIYRFDKDMRRITSRVYAEQAIPTGPKESPTWAAQRGWMREFSPDSKPADFREFQRTELSIEPVSYFSTEDPNADFMNYAQLRDYIERLRNGGLDVTMQRVSLEQKLAFPLVTLIMTLIAVPFAVTTGPRGAMYGIGAGLVLAFGYWGALTTFGALGAAGLFNPVVAAWAPNMLFGTAAIYLILTART